MKDMQYQLDLLDAMNQKLISDERMYQLLVDTSSSAFLYYNYQNGILRTLGNWDYYFPFSIRNLSDVNYIFDLIEDDFVLPLKNAFNIDKDGIEKTSVQVRAKETGMWISVEVTIVYDSLGRPLDRVYRFVDVTKYNLQNEELTYMAYYDPPTGLYNQNYFVRLLNDYLQEAKANNKYVAIMYIDIDDLRRVNDTLGLKAGDEIIHLFGQYLNQTFSGENICISHFSGDGFGIAIYDSHNGNLISDMYSKIQKRLESPFTILDGTKVTITVSVGVAEYPDAAQSTLELINCAEIVMYRTKHSGRNGLQYFDAVILQDFLKNVEIENKLREAMFQNNFVLYYQPQYSIKTGELRGVEALIRWRDVDGHMISPNLFIPIAENNGAIVPIGNWIIEDSIQRYVEWKKKFNISFTLSLNISAIQYKQNDFVEKIIKSIQTYGMDPEDLELEITESIFIEDHKDITQKLNYLRDYGIKIALDDFGTGYSSLSYLKGMPIDTLKIDKSFVDTMITDSNTRIITESILYMAKRLGLETIAEGVENKAQYDFLEDIGCTYIQGYFLGKPMPSEDIELMISRKLS